MYVKQLKLENMRSFKEATIEFSKGINILIGKNNSGKSTIIKCIYKLQANNNNCISSDDKRKFNDWKQEDAFIKYQLNDLNEKDRRLFNTSISGINIESDNIYCENMLSNRRGDSFYWIDLPESEWEGFDITLPSLTNYSYKFSPLSNKENDHNFIFPFLSNRKAGYYYKSSRISNMDVFDNLNNIVQKFSKKITGHNKELLSEKCKKILGFTPSIIEDANQEPDIGYYTDNNTFFSIKNMGEGVINIVGLLIYLYSDDRKLYLIEEPENDIHPEALKYLLDIIIEKSVSNQFIISTHSHIVLTHLGGIDGTTVHHVEWSNENHIQTSKVIKIETPELRSEVLNSLGYSVSDYGLYKGYLILEESSAQSLIQNFLIPEFVPDLLGRLKVIAANGVGDLKPKVNNFHNLFVYMYNNPVYKNQCWVIADGDTDGKKCIQELSKKYDENLINVSNWQKENLEYYFPTTFSVDINKIFFGSDVNQKRNLKANLLKKVFEWINQDRDNAKKEFEKSAKEIIEKLMEIDIALNKKNK